MPVIMKKYRYNLYFGGQNNLMERSMRTNKRFVMRLFMLLAIVSIGYGTVDAQQSVARQWNDQLLEAIRHDFARPTVHSRNLYHTSVAMYDAWAAYDSVAKTFLLGKTVGSYSCPFDGVEQPDDVEAARAEAISYASYRILVHRFNQSPDSANTKMHLDSLFNLLGYDMSFTSTNYQSGPPAALGNYIASELIAFGLQDGSNEQGAYENLAYEPINPPLNTEEPGNPDLLDPNRWQPLTLDYYVDQSGNVIPIDVPPFLGPEWGQVTPFSLSSDDLTIHTRDGFDYWVYHDPGPPPYLDTNAIGGLSEEYKWGFALVSAWGSHLDPADSVRWDISPGALGNIDTFPQTIEAYRDYYDFEEGGDPSNGHDLNPYTGEPYEPQYVLRADYGRVLAEFWADGPDSETPPGHWFTLLNYVNDHPAFEQKFKGQNERVNDLEWDVKAYFIMGGTMHDVAVSAWGIKGRYDYIRPVSAVRYMADLGQSSDESEMSYHPGGIPLSPGLIEVVKQGDPLQGQEGVDIGKIKLYTWRGPEYIDEPETDYAGVDWILAENWWPYQRPSFITPPFAGYVSGHSTFSRAASEVMTLLTGDAFFPGGMGEFIAEKNEFLVFEEGPSETITLQWATYRDASDQTSLSRIWGGIHPPADDIPGRIIGLEIGVEAFHFAETYFQVDADGDGYYSYEDCDDSNAEVNPGHPETCDGLDNNCDGDIDEDLATYQYYLDLDGDGFGDAEATLDTCSTSPIAGYVDNDTDCDDNSAEINPGAIDIPNNGIDEDCNGQDSISTGIKIVENSDALRFYPNPVEDELFIEFETTIDNGGEMQVQLNTTDGRVIIDTKIQFSNNTGVINLSNVPSGIYYIKVTDKENDIAFIHKIVRK